MNTTSITGTGNATAFPGIAQPAASSGTSGSPNQTPNASALNLTPANFVQFMITQMQNQDPLNPTSSDQMLQQMSQIGQLQSSTNLDTDLKGLVLQNQVGAASSLIGKQVAGNDAKNNPVTGLVSSVKVTTNSVSLQLDSGSTLDLGSVNTISTAPVVAGK